MVTSVFSYAQARSFGVLVVMGVLLGFGVGLTQSTVNGFIAKHYSAASMGWLHCCYAIGCMLAPVILSYFIIHETWRQGYSVAGSLHLVVLAVILLTVPLWKVIGPIFPKRLHREERAAALPVKSIRQLLRIPGGTIIPLMLFFYCSTEVTFFFWGTSFLTEERGMSAGIAAGMMTYLYVGQVIGRAACGVISLKVRDRIFIRVMLILMLAGIVLFLFSTNAMLPPVFLFIGFASGPIFPLLIHEVPSIVGKENAQGVIGIQLAASSMGTALTPLLLGAVAGKVGFWVFSVFIAVLFAAAFTLKMIQDHKYGKK